MSSGERKEVGDEQIATDKTVPLTGLRLRFLQAAKSAAARPIHCFFVDLDGDASETYRRKYSISALSSLYRQQHLSLRRNRARNLMAVQSNNPTPIMTIAPNHGKHSFPMQWRAND
jgi:hypothetical protein